MDTRPASVTAGFAFRATLQDLFEDCFVVEDFLYKGLVLDYAVITKDLLIEVRLVTAKEEYAAELAKVGRTGRFSFHKHKAIRDGKFITNAFYFLCRAGLLVADEMPPKYGLITYNKAGALDFKKLADFHYPEQYLTKSFYTTLARKLAEQLYK